MAGEDIASWSKTAASNGTADSSINWAEGQPRASVNDSARSMMAAVAKDRDLKNGSIVTGGTANAQTFSSGIGYSAIPAAGIWARLKVGPGLTNTGPMTLNMDSIGPVSVNDQTNNALAAGMWPADSYVEIVYDGVSHWRLVSSSRTSQVPLTTVYTGGSGTYSTPTGCTWLEVQLVGAGSGGNGAPAGSGYGGNGGNTTFGSCTAQGGRWNNYATVTGATWAVLGCEGGAGTESVAGGSGIGASGGQGAASFFGFGGIGTYEAAGKLAQVPGSGGGGGGCTGSIIALSGNGGGAGGYGVLRIGSPAASYSYSVGAGGSGGSGGSGGNSGGAGASGIIIVTAYFG
jgi:hypothetical protein